MSMSRGNKSWQRTCQWLGGVLLVAVVVLVDGNPNSKPYIALRTNPYDAEHRLEFPPDTTTSTVTRWDRGSSSSSSSSTQCPLQFSLGISKRWHRLEKATAAFSIRQPPVVRTVFPAAGPGKSVLYTTLYEHLDLLSPSSSVSAMAGDADAAAVVREALVQNPEYPWLWESSAFHASPIIHDVNGDGIPDVILVDYDGGIYMRGLASNSNNNNNKRYSHHAQAPRLYVRRNWVEGRVSEALGQTVNQTEDIHDPYHSYFEYYYADEHKEDVLRGITANHLGHDSEEAQALKERRKRRVSQKRGDSSSAGDNPGAQEETENNGIHGNAQQQDQYMREEELSVDEPQYHRRLQEEEGIPPREEQEQQFENDEPDPEERYRYDDIVGMTGDDMLGRGGMGGDGAGDDFYPMGDDYDRAEMEEEHGRVIDDDLGYGNPMVRLFKFQTRRTRTSFVLC